MKIHQKKCGAFGALLSLLIAQAGCGASAPRSTYVLTWEPREAPGGGAGAPIRTRVVWDAPSPRVMETLDAPTDDAVPSYNIRRRVEQLQSEMLSDEGDTSERAADVVVRVVGANFNRERFYECSNSEVGAAAVGVTLEARGRLRNGEDFNTVASEGNCELPSSSSSGAFFSACMDDAVAGAFTQIMKDFGARVRRRDEVAAP